MFTAKAEQFFTQAANAQKEVDALMKKEIQRLVNEGYSVQIYQDEIIATKEAHHGN